MDTPKDYIAAVRIIEEAVASAKCGFEPYIRCDIGRCDCRFAAKRAAEAIGLREMMERLAVLEAAREDALDHGVSTHG